MDGSCQCGRTLLLARTREQQRSLFNSQAGRESPRISGAFDRCAWLPPDLRESGEDGLTCWSDRAYCLIDTP